MRHAIFCGLIVRWAVLFPVMPSKPPKIEMRIINVNFPRFVIVNRSRYWTGDGWSRSLHRALLYADANVLRDDIERLKIRFS